MRFAREFRDGDLGRAVAAELPSLTRPGRTYKLMEVCGGHTHAIYRYGIEELLPDGVELVHGPGCPVCVLPMGRVDDARRDRPAAGGDPHLLRRHAAGARLARQPAGGQGASERTSAWSTRRWTRCGSPREHPDREVVFFAIGFETTAPSTALTLKRARREGVANFSCVCNHVAIEPPLRALLDSPDLQVDGFVGPGHVATVIGARPFEFIPREYGKPIVVSGFEPLDVLQSIQMLLGAARRGPLRGREPVPARGLMGGQHTRARGDGRGVHDARALRVAGPRQHPGKRAGAYPRRTRSSTPSAASRCRAWRSRTRASVSAARC